MTQRYFSASVRVVLFRHPVVETAHPVSPGKTVLMTSQEILNNARQSMPPGGTTMRNRLGGLALALIIAAVVYDILTPAPYTASAILAVAGPVAACVLSLRATASVAGGILVISLIMVALHDHKEWVQDTVGIIVLIALQLISVYVCWARVRREAELRTIRTVVEVTQRAVLPPVPPRIGGTRVGVQYEAASSASRIGGDLYAVEDTPYGLRMMIGDVRGKGLGTINSVATLVGSFRELTHHAADLPQLTRWMEDCADRITELRDTPQAREWFTTAVFAELDPEGHTVRMVNCGHPPPYRLRDRTPELVDTGPVLLPLGLGGKGRLAAAGKDGASRASTAPQRQVVEIPREHGDVLLFYTDGMSEARNRDGVFFDPTALLSRYANEPLEELLQHLVDGAVLYSGGNLVDDLTLLALG